MTRGRLIVIDGISGSGKSSLVEGILHYLREQDPDASVLITHQPGNTPSALKVKELRKYHKANGISTKEHGATYSKLYYEAGIEHSEALLNPNMIKGVDILCDRLTLVTQLAYQRREGVSLDQLRGYWDNIKIPHPDLLLLTRLNPQIAYERILSSGRTPTALETPEIMTELQDLFHDIPNVLPKVPTRIIDTSQSKQAVIEEAIKYVSEIRI
jgi:thymidylate kinase